MKNILNKIKFFKAFTFVMLIILGACDSFLTTPPLDKFSEDSFYTTPETAKLAVNAIYSNLGGEFSMRYLAEFGSLLENDDNLFGYIDETVYDVCYQGIYDANLAISNIPNIDFEGKDDAQNALLAEARTLRAYFYYQLSLYLGPVIMITEPISYKEIFTYARPEDIEVTRSFIRDELIASIPDLPSRDDSENGRVSKDFARFILAQEYMLEGNWEQAEKYLSEIMNSGDYSLLSDYGEICSYDTKLSVCDAWEFNDESIFEVSFIEGMEEYSHNWFDQLTPQPCSGGAYRIERARLPENLYTRVFLNEYKVDTFVATQYDAWISRQDGQLIEVNPGETAAKPSYKEDPRRIHTMITYGDEMICVENDNIYEIMDATNTSKNSPDFLLRKYWPTSDKAYAEKRGRNFILIRYAQVLLDYAEVQYRLGNTSVAYDYLNAVRGRAWDGYPEEEWKKSASSNLYPDSDWNTYVKAPLMAKGYDKFFVDLIQEYILEFTTEGITTPLMMRWKNRADLAEFINIEEPNNIYTERPFFGWPEIEVSQNPNIWQNPGFN
jgi:starch-binding outer membrane protein, SusD/RagB family